MSTLQPGDKLLPLGSVIGAEVCLRRNMPSLTTVVVLFYWCHSIHTSDSFRLKLIVLLE